jgi:FixJ family two-component response regulator
VTSAQAVVVIDDDPSVRRGIVRLLRASGFSVQSFASAEEFLASPSAGPDTCLVLDIHLGGMSGLDLADCLDRRGRSIPIVFISAQDGALPAARRTQTGTIALLHKPFDESVFLEAVRRALATSPD